jgi:hypothetical protein
MCQFNLAIVDSDSDDLKLKKVFEENNLHFSVIQIKNFDAQPGLSYKIIFTTGNLCDCVSAIGSEKREDSVNKKLESEIKELRWKKWSEIKIKRFIESKTKADTSKSTEASEELERWNKTIKSCLNNKLTKRFGILIHYFSEPHSEEKFENTKITKRRLFDFKLEELKKVEIDNILLVEYI